MLMDHFLAPRNDLQEIPLSNIDFAWFTNGSYLKGNNGKYCAGYAIVSPFHVVEVASLPMATLAQQTELYPFTGACTLAKDKTTHVYIDSRYAFRVDHDLGLLWKQHGFPPSSRNKIKNSPICSEIIECNTCCLSYY